MATDSAGEAVRPAGGWTGPGLAFSLGVGGFHLLTEPLPWGWLLAPAIVLALATWGWGTRHRSLRAAAWALLFGVAWAQFHACLTLCHPFPETYTRSDLEVEGRIASLPVELGTARRFLVIRQRIVGSSGVHGDLGQTARQVGRAAYTTRLAVACGDGARAPDVREES